jgi:hypothetical protein
VVETPPPPPVEESQTAEFEQVMESSITIVNQVDAITEENDSQNDEPEEEAEALNFIDDGATNNAFIQVIQPEDLGDSADTDDAPAMTANCVCN